MSGLLPVVSTVQATYCFKGPLVPAWEATMGIGAFAGNKWFSHLMSHYHPMLHKSSTLTLSGRTSFWQVTRQRMGRFTYVRKTTPKHVLSFSSWI